MVQGAEPVLPVDHASQHLDAPAVAAVGIVQPQARSTFHRIDLRQRREGLVAAIDVQAAGESGPIGVQIVLAVCLETISVASGVDNVNNRPCRWDRRLGMLETC